MNREIKFRAWDGDKYIHFDNHKYDLVYNDITGWNVKPNLPNYKGEWTAGESQIKTPGFILQQYTGLKDKNGKEIYEGDILRTKHFVDRHGKQHYLHHKVVWSNEFLGWRAVNISETDEPDRTKNGSPQLWVYIKGTEFEVVGNIYENNQRNQ